MKLTPESLVRRTFDGQTRKANEARKRNERNTKLLIRHMEKLIAERADEGYWSLFINKSDPLFLKCEQGVLREVVNHFERSGFHAEMGGCGTSISVSWEASQ